MKRNEIEFDAEALVGSVAFAAHVQGERKLTLRTHHLPRSKPIAPMTPEAIANLRQPGKRRTRWDATSVSKTPGTSALHKSRAAMKKLSALERLRLRKRATELLSGQGIET